MKRKIFSALFLCALMAMPCGVFAAASEPEPTKPAAEVVSNVEPTAVEAGEETKSLSKWEKFLEKMPRISGYLQTGWNYSNQGDGSSSFQAKRLRLLMDGNVCKWASFRLQIEGFNNIAGTKDSRGKKSLQIMDAFATAKVREGFQIRAGQFFLPIGYENYDISPATLETVDFSNICYRMECRNPINYDFIDYGRDIGVMLMGNLFKHETDGFYRLSYNLSVTNGTLPNTDDSNKSKDVVASLTYRPGKFWNIKAAFNWGEYDNPKQLGGDATLRNKSMNRMVVGAWYNNPEGLDVRAEYGHVSSHNLIKEDGFYFLAAYHLGKFLPVARYDMYRDDKVVASANNYDRVLVGCTYAPCKFVKVQANYAHSFFTHKVGNDNGFDQIQIMGIFQF